MHKGFRARERKPPWLRLLAPDGNIAQLEAAVCGTCGRWVLRCRQGVWEAWDPGVIQGDDLTVAIILGVRLTRLKTVYGMCGRRSLMCAASVALGLMANIWPSIGAGSRPSASRPTSLRRKPVSRASRGPRESS